VALRSFRPELAMNEVAILGAVCVLVIGYLTFALLKPEKF
jgi:K+-transporting ATPase KdpF subunit